MNSLSSLSSGRHSGVCALLAQRLGRPLLHLACHHHIAELVLRSVYEVYWKGTSGPNVQLFQRFQKEWNDIDKNQYQPGVNDDEIASISNQRKDQILNFITEQYEVLSSYSDIW